MFSFKHLRFESRCLTQINTHTKNRLLWGPKLMNNYSIIIINQQAEFKPRRPS